MAILVVCARHLLAVEPPPLTLDRLAQFVAGYTFPQLVALFAQSPDARVRDDAARLRRLVLAGQVVYHGVMHGLPVALGDPFFRLDLARAAATAGLDLFPSTRSGRWARGTTPPYPQRATRRAGWPGTLCVERPWTIPEPA